MFMFCNRPPKVSIPTSFADEKCLINKQSQYRSLGEIIAMAKATGEAPLPTRNGVYTGEDIIPREQFDKIAARNKLMDSLDKSERELSKLQEDERLAAEERKSAEIAQKAIADYKASLSKGAAE